MSNSQQWNNEMNKISKEIIHKLHDMKLPENPVIIFDIDDTLINSQGEVIEQVVMIYNYAKKLGITPMIITSRPAFPYNMEWTRNQLMRNNITGYHSIYMRPVSRTDQWNFKLQSRKHIYDHGFNAVMSIGDQAWDIGEYGGIGVRIPTPSYLSFSPSQISEGYYLLKQEEYPSDSCCCSL